MIKTSEKVNPETGEITDSFVDDDEIVLPELPAEEKEQPEKEINVKDELEFFKSKLLRMTVKQADKITRRIIEVGLIGHLSEFYSQYDVVMVCDTSPFDRRIEQEEQAKVQFEAAEQTNMFDEMKQKELEKFDEKINGLREDRQTLIDRCETIAFSAKVLRINDSKNFPIFELMIAPEVANKLNTAWDLTANYKMQLQFIQ